MNAFQTSQICASVWSSVGSVTKMFCLWSNGCFWCILPSSAALWGSSQQLSNSDSRIIEQPLKHVGDRAMLAICCRGNNPASTFLSFQQHSKKTGTTVSIRWNIKKLTFSHICQEGCKEQKIFVMPTGKRLLWCCTVNCYQKTALDCARNKLKVLTVTKSLKR